MLPGGAWKQSLKTPRYPRMGLWGRGAQRGRSPEEGQGELGYWERRPAGSALGSEGFKSSLSC